MGNVSRTLAGVVLAALFGTTQAQILIGQTAGFTGAWCTVTGPRCTTWIWPTPSPSSKSCTPHSEPEKNSRALRLKRDSSASSRSISIEYE